MTLPVALSGTDIIGQAKTGTGKTLGFGLPLLERVTVPVDVEAGRAAPEALTDAPQALVVVPTRELCTQVTNDLLTAGKVRNVRVTAIYGGRAYEPQVEALRKGVDVVVGTPGRLLDLAGQKKLDLKHVKCLVLDEADEMLDLGFLPDVEKIMDMLPARRQTMLFSATMPGAVIGLARRYMSQPTHIRATSPDDEGATVANIKQHVYRAHSMDKPEMVARILQAEGRALAMIFCRTKRTAADIAEQLERRGFASGAVHGDLGQGAREQALRAFRNGKVDVLVCTDVAARGIDVENVTHVINYQSPEDEKTYLHRIGRTGRAGASGTAITLVDWDDIPRWQLINKALELGFNDPPETYSTSPHLFEELSIPAGTKGVLPRSERTRAGLDAEVLEDLGEPGGRGRGGRGGRGDRDRRGGGERDRRGGRGESAAVEAEAGTERPSRTPRRRRRTRGGSLTEQGAAPAVAPQQPQPSVAEEAAPAGRTPRRRRRTRGGSQDSVVTTPVTPSVEQVAPAAAEEAVTNAEGAAQPRRRTRTRRGGEQAQTPAPVVSVEAEAVVTPVAEPVAKAAPRRARKATAAVETAVVEPVVAEPAAVEPAVAETVEAKPRRTRKTAAAKAAEAVVEPAGTAVDAVEAVADAAEVKPRRTRKTAAAKAAEAVVEAAETVEAPKPRRTRKTAAAKAAEAAVEAVEVVETVEAVEAKPRRTRKTAATKTAAAPVTEAPAEVEATEAKPRRTRKTAATKAAEATVDTAEAVETIEVAKPRRTRKAAAPAEVAVETAEGAEAPKPRRTRKTAAAKAAEAAVEAVDVVETVEAVDAVEAPKPRRTRKTAATKTAAAPVTEAPAEVETAEAKPRRTRKTAATKAAEAAVDTAEAVETVEVAKPRRTRKTAAPSEAPAAPVEAAEEPKPRRRTTRKAATAAEIPAQATEEPAAKPRRTRKTAAAAEPTDG
ncbi:DEAD/DEAH box helicase [Streptomyces sp. NPDC004539]|uniref:DEAD/DEAH box helicase n=1 Tax=Streptomyces sp. NPDC004539 TaxID=3154280 RepID=UPI0033BDD94A